MVHGRAHGHLLPRGGHERAESLTMRLISRAGWDWRVGEAPSAIGTLIASEADTNEVSPYPEDGRNGPSANSRWSSPLII